MLISSGQIASPNVRSTILTFSSAITPGQPCAHTDTLTSSRAPEARSMEAIRIYRRLTRIVTGHRQRWRCRAHDERCGILREASQRQRTTGQAKRPPPEIPAQIHGQQGISMAYVQFMTREQNLLARNHWGRATDMETQHSSTLSALSSSSDMHKTITSIFVSWPTVIRERKC